ncbi:MAG: hypothetical protein E7G65_01390 [Veillonella sp.]|uniref:hypothetical protein n=1 Tax=Veillonella sp. TaxID=1926307 RepID=UPI00290DEE0D|nr:hypothetical protein [Veillonella sp.]MDU3822820.1 hypothetical protein [Veillonella sp.]
MNDKVKSYLQIIYGYRWLCIIVGIVILLTCVWLYANRISNIDTTGIRNAEKELLHAREYNQQAVDYNQRVRNAVESSQAINERTEERINRSVELNQRTENAINRSTELTTEARADAERAKAIIRESRNILERAKERNTQSQDGATQK